MRIFRTESSSLAELKFNTRLESVVNASLNTKLLTLILSVLVFCELFAIFPNYTFLVLREMKTQVLFKTYIFLYMYVHISR